MQKKLFDLMKNTPQQAQKTIFTKFILIVQWGQASELNFMNSLCHYLSASTVYIIMKIHPCRGRLFHVIPILIIDQ